MYSFTLDQGIEKAFPVTMEIGGREYGVCWDFRRVLRILRMLEDEEVLERHKYLLLRKWFLDVSVETGVFGDGEEQREASLLECAEGFARFVLGAVGGDGGEERSFGGERQFDFIFDAREIYVSFLREYGVDLLKIGELHFYKFCLMLTFLSEESPLKQKIAVRFYDLTGLKGKALAEMTAAKERVQIPDRLTAGERMEQLAFEKAWGDL